ncbi:primosomal protein N' [Microcoleus sp. FACHB-831]|uniref:primosomal protein N' n=1 Tax=Microcoleus sp. FACHB-831 TaxID=2692827 RepID=UPI001682DCFF|nr:primosomal protein N' [Microcoleus sp. FACHB-831]MBD1922919.1 primosomal protein N' [Microcoleus sp. FACHB-831]
MSNQYFGLYPLVVAEPGGSYDTNLAAVGFVEVLVDCPGAQGLYTYRLPAELEVSPGDILSVPFGPQQVGAIAIRLLSDPPADFPIEKIKNVEDVAAKGFFPPCYWELLNRLANYYYTPLIQVIKVALPPGLLGRSQRRIRLKDERSPGGTGADAFLSPAARQILQLLQSQPDGDYSWQYLQRGVKGAYRGLRELLRSGWVESYMEAPRTQKPKLQKAVTLIVDEFPAEVTVRQREILEVLRRRGGDLWQTELLQICNASSSTLKTLEQKGCVVIQERELLRTSAEPVLAGDRPKDLTKSQSDALKVITGLSGFAQVLLHGVTGSGKTEVYLQAIAPILARGQSALVLVPEIGLTPQLTDRFRARFGNKVCVYHSALSDGERYDTWRQMLTGTAQVVIGTRSAVFAPLPNLGLILLDEEHDDSFKQDQPAPTYHARTVALWRAELENCPLVLGSATPSLETWIEVRGAEDEEAAENPKSYYLSLPERIQSRPLPPVEIVDMRQELQQGNRSIFSRSLHDALQQLQDEGKQGILFIHRRGHSTFVSCRSCGNPIECPNCDVSLAYHHTHEGAPELLRCHYCNFVRSQPQSCPECSSPYLKFFGSGTQRVAQELAQQFPDLRLIRFDSDTTRTKGAHRTLLTRFANKEADLLVGTQMLTKGLDLPQVTLVGVVAADGLLHLPDYRASERAFQTLTQVAGRSGRGDDPGRVIIQTYSPEHAVIEAVRRHEHASFVETELIQRAMLNYPPYGRLILLKLSSLDATEVANAAQIVAASLRTEEEGQTRYEILGPAPAGIMRVANKYRWQILVKFDASALPSLPDWNEVRSLCPPEVSLTIDVDPLNLM